MKLKKLFKNCDVEVPANLEALEINKIHYDSRKVGKGDLFVAVKGFQTDGHKFLKQVENQGAAVAVVNQKDESLKLNQVVVEDSRAIMALLAYNYYEEYLEKLDLIGITGTNGKTTCSYLIRSILEAEGISCGLAGTIHYVIGAKKIDAWNTTPEAIDLYEMLAQMQQAGNKACVLEVSSHALALGRVDGLKFKAALFTNLSRDHMDFHKDMDTYFADKSKLFSQLEEEGFAITNNDDPYGAKITARNKISFGTKNNADAYSNKWQVNNTGMQLDVQIPTGLLKIESAMVGEFNVYNLLGAVATGLALNLSPDSIKKGLANQKSVPGRLETHQLKNKALAIIDYAHTPDAMEKALSTVRQITENKLTVVFGCGGDRDRGKRPQMGEVAQKWADHTIVTDDNPRTENPQQIINDILAGMKKDSSMEIINDRRNAITKAVKNSTKGDVVLIAGKGHENYQVIGKVKHDFDEAAIIQEADYA
ncbi:MAG: UDP-N-acetylmuramoyl-L-alanyl-D-glutamate--2,6-diaminopimelate ligase [Calditrichaeota bacterium]|nr:MAG: UDP-N-acetylmuramoyl-L-alanyl-D-glutamate--2,6-diaminopimelate ligase [Calditrichota bacterium]MBL1206552.1 UDP-N-acetylmuramoyl-L-alanyl-D-glutamate--2,6-diaminopimelate ligase [Calditrichota bacterium]NOG46379.1 UDP-N-acetylmuramoyl-L-alanyl-D-glutamate--2,6-diaminopimelate ligase [Calditrichota bacterium]